MRDGGVGAGDDRRARRRDRRRAHRGRARAASTRRRASSARATSPRRVVQRASGATTVGGTLAVCRDRGHPLHGDRRARRRAPRLADAARCLGRPAGARRRRRRSSSRPASSRCSTCPRPRSCSRRSACRCSAGAPTRCRSSTPRAAARRSRRASSRRPRRRAIARAHWELGGGGLLLGRPPDESLDDVEPLIEAALAAADAQGVHGQARDAVRPRRTSTARAAGARSRRTAT